MNEFKATVYRKIEPVEKQYQLSLHRIDNITIEGETSFDAAKECVSFSLESNDSVNRPDQNLFFVIFNKQNIPIAFGSPQKKGIVWDETSFKVNTV